MGPSLRLQRPPGETQGAPVWSALSSQLLSHRHNNSLSFFAHTYALGHLLDGIFCVCRLSPLSFPLSAPLARVKFLSPAALHANHWLIPIQYMRYTFICNLLHIAKSSDKRLDLRMSYFKKWKGKSPVVNRVQTDHCFDAVACERLKLFVACWVTILLGKWNLKLSTGQRDPASPPQIQCIQAFLWVFQLSCIIYGKTPVLVLFFYPPTLAPLF